MIITTWREKILSTDNEIRRLEIVADGQCFIIKKEKGGGIRVTVQDGIVVVTPCASNKIVIKESGF